jgi:HTH-type transcriptional regulator, glycine betaine synthesis regulator
MTMKSAPDFPLKANRAGNPEDFQAECIELFAEVVYALGLPRSIGQIYGLLYASPAPLSFSDIVERLEISKGSASQGLQLLRSLGAVKPVSRSYSLTVRQSDGATARDYYEPELGLRRLLGGIIRGRIEPLVGQGRTRMKHLRVLAEAAADGAHKEFQLERVEQLETWRRQATLLLPVMKTLLRSPKR